MNKKRKGLFIACLIILIAAAAALAGYHIIQNRNAHIYDEMAEEATVPEPQEESAPSEAAPEVPKPDIPIDFELLQAQNRDIYAWIRIPDTEVDYPILHSEIGDEDYYLDHTADGTEGLPGSLYTQYSKNPDITADPVTVIYGHNMKNGSMFGSLKHYQDEEYRQAHPEILVYTPEHILKYRVTFAVTFDDRLLLDSYNFCETERDTEMLLEAIQTERQLPSWTEEPFEVTGTDRLIILSTCNSHYDQRFLVGAVLTEEQ